MNKVLLSILGLSIILQPLMGQEVNSKAYDLMLSGMLSHSVKEISVKEASDIKDAIFLDSREKKEYQVSHLPKAKWVGYDSLDLSALDKVPKDSKIIVYCSVGYRSEKVSEKIKAKGFTDVQNLYGGIFEWVNQGNKVVDPNGYETPKVHAYSMIWGIWLSKGEKVYD